MLCLEEEDRPGSSNFLQGRRKRRKRRSRRRSRTEQKRFENEFVSLKRRSRSSVSGLLPHLYRAT